METGIKACGRLSGIITPVVTPFLDTDQLDMAAAELLFDHLITGGVSGLFLLGTTGEFAGIPHPLRHEFVRESLRIIGNRIPVYVGISDTSFTESVELAHTAAVYGATAVVLTTPYYYRFSGDVMLNYFVEMSKAVSLPIILYNMPGNTKVWIEQEVIRRVLDLPQYIGIKDSGGDLDYFAKLLKLCSARPDFSVMMGPDLRMGQAVSMGADGGVNSGSNLCPEVYVGMYRAAKSKDTIRMAEYQKQIELVNEIYRIPQNGLRVPTGLKASLALLGIGGVRMTLPFPSATREEIAAIRTVMERLEYSVTDELCKV